MPLFDFVCRSCKAEFESLVRAGHPAACPNCGSTDLDKQVSSVALKTTDRSRAAAAANRRRYADEGRRDTLERERDSQKHKHEDH
jgi:putative FmdB family regulatory protein